jgi:hypothetical protein
LKLLYNQPVEKITNSREYRPELLPRRGEIIAWGLSLVVAAAWFIVQRRSGSVPLAVPILEAFLLFSALSISLGNWMDRRTFIRLDGVGIAFQNGLRNVHLGWREIRQVRVLPTRWGKKVEVVGDRAHFQFRTSGEVKVQGETKGRVGFAQGDEILRQLILSSALKIVDHPGEGYYYEDAS